MSESTQVFFETFKGYPVLAIWAIDASGERKGKAPLISFGSKKAQAILNHQKEIEQWVAEQESPKSRSAFNLNKLNPAQQKALSDLLSQASS